MSRLQDHGFVHARVAELSSRLGELAAEGGHRTAERMFTPDELRAVKSALDQAREHDPDPGTGAYFARDPLISLVQSAIYEHRMGDAAAPAVEHEDERMGDPFTQGDLLGWGLGIGLSLIWRFLHRSHPFNDAPAVLDAGPSARLVLVSDWGTGRPEARQVIDHAATYLDEGDAGHGAVHLVHLGDTYYSGTPLEAQRHVLDLWPVHADDAGRIGSWALNGNHDMYSGGHGYFETTLGDERFHRQQAGGRSTSWFHLRGDGWDVVGLDSAWRDPLVDLRHGRLFLFGALGDLHGSQPQYVADLSAAEDRRLVLLSHHQLFSAYDLDGTRDNAMRDQLAPVLQRNAIDAWFWGHEHDCLAYEPLRGVTAARAIGHGAVPQLARATPPPQPGVLDPPRLVKPTVAPATPADDPLRALAWEYRDYELGDDGNRWGKHGFAVLDISPDGLRARYVDQDGVVYVDEQL